ncbi:MAG: hypothetical protein LBV02_01165 [Bacteroidales bacterium]|jgi:hypothetical protein|nr:hypothetical protein [Bacteroidales bacterium]
MNNNPWQEKKRPTALIVLPILTYIGSSIMLMTTLLMGAKNFLTDLLENAYQMGFDDNVLKELQSMMEIPSWVFYFFSGCLILTVIGAALMMRMEKIGFHIFVISKLLLFGCAVITGHGVLSLNSTYFLGSVIFALLYFNQLKYMRKGEEDKGINN